MLPDRQTKQALRGSSEFHAWGDSNLYLRRKGEPATLTVEHRAAAAIPDIRLRLVADEAWIALQIDDAPQPSTPPSSPLSSSSDGTAASERRPSPTP